MIAKLLKIEDFTHPAPSSMLAEKAKLATPIVSPPANTTHGDVRRNFHIEMSASTPRLSDWRAQAQIPLQRDAGPRPQAAFRRAIGAWQLSADAEPHERGWSSGRTRIGPADLAHDDPGRHDTFVEGIGRGAGGITQAKTC
jgi:hypothetical protein